MTRFLSAFLLSLVAAAVSAAPLDNRIEQLTSEGASRRAMWGVYAVDAKSGDVLADVNGKRLFVPASNRKLVATALASTAFEKGHQFRTELRAGSIDSDGTLKGDLIVLASGDPSLTPGLLNGATGGQKLRQLAKEAAAAGIERVAGDLVIDPGPFTEADPIPPGWSWEEFSLIHGSTPSALAVNQNLVSVSLAPSGRGNPVEVTFATGFEVFTVENQSVTGAPGSAPTLTVERPWAGSVLRLRGSMAQGSAPVGRAIPAYNPTELAGRMFQEALEKEGITIDGKLTIASRDLGGTTVVSAIEGATIAEIMTLCNEDSNNFLAESLYLLAAAKLAGRASYGAAANVENNYWKRIDVDSGEILSADGSGLSRKNAISPHALVMLLKERQGTEWFVETLPVSGKSGTLRGRLGGPLAGRVYAKTGTLDGVVALSGYVKGSSGRRICFAILANNFSSSPSPIRATIDRIVGVISER
jgi:D-alanyl-D-alanine carboxypeptidase/D-alanyl-D-alanine-endopeptidase (penicillin-binding protein 4)